MGDNAMGEPTALLGGTALGDATSGDISSGDGPGVCWDDVDFKDIQIDMMSPLATNPWGGIDLEEI